MRTLMRVNSHPCLAPALSKHPSQPGKVQGWEKVLSGHLGQVDFPVPQVTFLTYLTSGQAPRQVVPT